MGNHSPSTNPVHDVEATAHHITTRAMVAATQCKGASPYSLGHVAADARIIQFIQSQAYHYSRAVHALNDAGMVTPEVRGRIMALQRDYEKLERCFAPAAQRELLRTIDTNMLELAVDMRLMVAEREQRDETRLVMRRRVYEEAGRRMDA